jgi:hypothetical protein
MGLQKSLVLWWPQAETSLYQSPKELLNRDCVSLLDTEYIIVIDCVWFENSKPALWLIDAMPFLSRDRGVVIWAMEV